VSHVRNKKVIATAFTWPLRSSMVCGALLFPVFSSETQTLCKNKAHTKTYAAIAAGKSQEEKSEPVDQLGDM
jgi:hypothetical protein